MTMIELSHIFYGPDDPESDFDVYRFRVVLFGSVSSSFMPMSSSQ